MTGLSALRQEWLTRPQVSTSYYQLRSYPDPCLKEKAVPVSPTTDLDDDLLPRMKEILAEHKGLGLASQQVGSLWAVALMMLTKVTVETLLFDANMPQVVKDMQLRELTVAINPKILEHSKEMAVHIGEGCLSAQSKSGEYFRTSVRRYQWVVMRWENEARKQMTRKLSGLDAIVAQHEIDHLAGKCIVDGLERPQRRQLHRLMGIE